MSYIRKPRMFSPCGCGAWFDHGQARRTRCDRCMHSLTADGAKKAYRPKQRRMKHGPFVCRSPACRREYMAKAPDRNAYCSRACHAEHKAVRAAYRAHLEHDAHVAPAPSVRIVESPGTAYWRKHIMGRVQACPGCGVEWCAVMGAWGVEYCSRTCKLRASRVRMKAAGVKRLRLHRKRCRKYGGLYMSGIKSSAVFELDDWHCQICGVETPRALIGTGAMDEPTLDHIIPLSQRGAHAWNNLWTLCRMCNSKKRDQVCSLTIAKSIERAKMCYERGLPMLPDLFMRPGETRWLPDRSYLLDALEGNGG